MEQSIIDKALKILERPVCDHCLGRQFGQLLHGYTNEERGRLVRQAAAMQIDNEKMKTSADMSNFSQFKFHNLETGKQESMQTKRRPSDDKCSVCNGMFEKLDDVCKKAVKRARNAEYNTFLVGTKLSHDLLAKEEELWEEAGIDWCEPIKSELNREIGKRIEKLTGKKAELKRPDVNFIIDFGTGTTKVEKNPLFIYGEYQKLKRGIPQTKWPDGRYKTSVEQIIAKPLMAASGGKSHKLHGAGREDIDARCLGWRPFVLEISEPSKRRLDLQKLTRKIGRDVRIRNACFTNTGEVRRIKEARPEKTYRCVVGCKEGISKGELKKLQGLVKTINQRTPQRVLHRRADKNRKRKVISIKTKYINGKKFEAVIRGEAGLYVKELVSGDGGRTRDSFSSVLGKECACKELDVVGVHMK